MLRLLHLIQSLSFSNIQFKAETIWLRLVHKTGYTNTCQKVTALRTRSTDRTEEAFRVRVETSSLIRQSVTVPYTETINASNI